MSQYKIEAGTGQHIGDRQEQQDRTALFAAPHAPGYVMAVVADGMGGKSGGALAAEQVVRTAKQLFDEFYPGNDVRSLLENIVNEGAFVGTLRSRFKWLASEKSQFVGRDISDRVLKLVYGTMKCKLGY